MTRALIAVGTFAGKAARWAQVRLPDDLCRSSLMAMPSFSQKDWTVAAMRGHEAEVIRLEEIEALVAAVQE